MTVLFELSTTGHSEQASSACCLRAAGVEHLHHHKRQVRLRITHHPWMTPPITFYLFTSAESKR